MKAPLPLLCIMICTHLLPLYGKRESLATKLQAFLDETNTLANINSADLFYDDTIGVNFLGGSGIIRTQVSDISPVHLSLPRLNVGCGGIDYTMGALNIVSKDEMVKTLKNIAKNAATHAFLLGLETASPVVAGTISKVQHWANQLNAININSCEIGSGLVDGIWPSGDQVSEYICSQAGAKDGLFSDRIEARHGCRERQGKKRVTTLNHVQNEGLLVGDYNLGWEVIKKLNLNDKNIQDLYLNISGTIVKKGESIQFFPSKAEEALDVLIYGGVINNSYRFQKINSNFVGVEDKQTISIKAGRCEKDRIWQLLNAIQSKILEEGQGRREPLTESEKALITNTQFPIASLMILMGQWEGKNIKNHLSLRECAAVIAFEKVADYVEEIVKTLIFQTEALQSKQIEQSSFEAFKKSLEQVLSRIERQKMDNYRKISEKQKMIQFLIEIEKNLRSKLGSDL